MKKSDVSANPNINPFNFCDKNPSRIYTFLIRYFYFFTGLFISVIGNYFIISAKNLGVNPWDVLHLGISRYFPSIGLGTIGIAVGMFLLIPSYLMGVKPRVGTFLNIYYYGLVLNMLMSSHLLEIPQNLFASIVYLMIGIFITGIGTALYLQGNAGAGPRDSLMLGIHQRTRFNIAQVRSGIEVSVVAIGFMLGGSVGIGTLIFSLTIGISVQWAMRWVKRFGLKVSSSIE